MYLEDVKRRYWLVAGALAGLALGWGLVSTPPARDPVVRPPISAERFVQMVREVTHATTPVAAPQVLRDVTIEPADRRHDFVTGTALTNGTSRPFAFYADRPFSVDDVRAPSVAAFMGSAAADHPQLV